MRLFALFLILLAAYAATSAAPARPAAASGGPEPHHLLAAESIVSDHDVDLADEYRERAYASWYPGELKTDGKEVAGRLVEPHGAGFALLIAPAYAIGGARAVQAEMAFLLALAFGFAAALARRMVPEPWATPGVGLVGLSPPALAAGTTVAPGVAAAAAITGAAVCALRVRERARLRYVFGGALLLAVLPWLGWMFAVPGFVVAWALVTWTLRERRRLAALIAGEALAASLVFYATLNDRFYGGVTPPGGRAAGRGRPGRPTGRSSRSATWTGSRGWPRCGWTARSACCAGLRCLRSCSSPAGCCTARAATSSRASRRRGARPSRRPSSRSESSPASSSSPRWRERSRSKARRSPASRWSRRCPPPARSRAGACATCPACSPPRSPRSRSVRARGC